MKASALKDPTAVDTLATLIPASKAEEALVRKAGSKVWHQCCLSVMVSVCVSVKTR